MNENERKAAEMASALDEPTWVVLDGWSVSTEYGPGFHVTGCELSDAMFTTECREHADQLCALLNHLTDPPSKTHTGNNPATPSDPQNKT